MKTETEQGIDLNKMADKRHVHFDLTSAQVRARIMHVADWEKMRAEEDKNND